MKEKNGFTALRLFAAFLVLFTHSSALLSGKQDFLGRQHLPQLSELAVDAFFVISGYLVCLSLLRNPNPFIFIRNRCLRIFPALIVVILFTICVVGPFFYSGKNYWQDAHPWQYLWNISLYRVVLDIPGVFANNLNSAINGSIWTLIIECYCYIGLLAFSLCHALNWRSVTLYFIVALCLHQFHFFSAWYYFQTDRLSVFFAGGVLLALLKNKISFHPILLISAIAVIVFAFSGRDWPNWYQPIAFMVLFPYVVIAIALNLKKLHGLDSYDCSYGIYIYAFVIQQSLIALIGVNHLTSTLFVILSTLVTIPFALASWFFIEKPMMSLKGKQIVFPKISKKLSVAQ